MENELVREIKASCKKIDEVLYAKHDEFTERGIDVIDGRDDLEGIAYLNDIARLIVEEQIIYRNVKSKNALEKKEEIDKLQSEAVSKLIDAEKYLKSKEVVRSTYVNTVYNQEENEDKEETVEVTNVHESSNGLVFAGGVVAGLAAGLLGSYWYNLNKDKKDADVNITNNVDIVEETEIHETETDEVDKSNSETTNSNLVLGEYGTFTDITSNEQIEARAEYLYDNFYAKLEDKIDENRLSKMFGEHKDHITKEGIANVIRSMNGIPRVNENGEYYVTANMKDQILNEAAFYLFGVPSACYDQNNSKVYQNIPSHLFFADDSEASRFLAGYDEAYQEFCDAYNRNDGAAAYEAGQKIASKMWYEWHLDGVFGDQNPYLLNAQELKLARMCSVDKWVNYIYEFEQDMQTTICVPLCVDYNTKELTELRGDEIQQAITYDLWEDTVAISAGMKEEVQKSKLDHGVKYENQIFADYLMNEIYYQYENNYKDKTVNDEKVLTLK